jgi:hypothetical protein
MIFKFSLFSKLLSVFGEIRKKVPHIITAKSIQDVFGSLQYVKINFREYRRGNQKWTFQRN